MEILGIGPLELLLIVLLALIILGPKEMQKMGKSLGRGLNKLVKSDIWKDIRQTSEQVKNLPTQLMRDAELEIQLKSFNNPVENPPKIAPSSAVEIPPKQPPQTVPPEGSIVPPDGNNNG